MPYVSPNRRGRHLGCKSTPPSTLIGVFDHYLRYRAVDAKQRRRVRLTATMSASATAALVMSTWVSSALQVHRVQAPVAHAIIVSPMPGAPLPKPAAPPPAPKGEPDAEPERETPAPPDRTAEPVVPSDDVPTDSTAPQSESRPGGPRGLPDGIQGVASSSLVGVPVAQIGGGGAEPPPPRTPPVARKPMHVLRARALYAPSPDRRKAGALGAFGRLAQTNVTGFCIDLKGKTTRVKTVRGVPGNPRLDALCSPTVQTWRFRPVKVEGRPTVTCSEVTFEFVRR